MQVINAVYIETLRSWALNVSNHICLHSFRFVIATIWDMHPHVASTTPAAHMHFPLHLPKAWCSSANSASALCRITFRSTGTMFAVHVFSSPSSVTLASFSLPSPYHRLLKSHPLSAADARWWYSRPAAAKDADDNRHAVNVTYVGPSVVSAI